MQDPTKGPINYAAITRDELIAERSQQIQTISQSLTTSPPREEAPRRIQETIFKEVFLPLFMGKPNERYPEIQAANWITVAGSPHAEVEVVDHTNTIVFVVPPLIESEQVAPITGKLDVDMSFVTGQARLYGNSLPQVAENYLMEELTKRTSYMKSNADVSATMTAWKKIFAYYGLLKAADVAATPNNKPPIDLDYEDVPP
jgi:hypothetical protein